jgi:hypothetical protein
MTANRKYGIALLLVFACLVWSTAAFADFAGKVVTLMDGDTLEVLKPEPGACPGGPGLVVSAIRHEGRRLVRLE